MSPEDELDFILKCIKHGEVKVDFVAVDKERRSANKVPGKSARQFYDVILKKYGVKRTGSRAANGTNSAGTPLGALKLGRKRSVPAEAEGNGKVGKKVKGEGDHDECEAKTECGMKV